MLIDLYGTCQKAFVPVNKIYFSSFSVCTLKGKDLRSLRLPSGDVNILILTTFPLTTSVI